MDTACVQAAIKPTGAGLPLCVQHWGLVPGPAEAKAAAEHEWEYEAWADHEWEEAAAPDE